jgi:thymidylate synthase
MRSVDVALGLPFNIASYAALLCLIARITDKNPGSLIFTMEMRTSTRITLMA